MTQSFSLTANDDGCRLLLTMGNGETKTAPKDAKMRFFDVVVYFADGSEMKFRHFNTTRNEALVKVANIANAYRPFRGDFLMTITG